jgi:alpha-1,2-mannosyltransferase
MRRVWWVLYGVIGVVSSVLVLRRPFADRLADLQVYYGAVKTVQSGQPLYDFATATNDAPFTYPPFALLVFWPMGWVGEDVVRVIWLGLICLALAAIAAAVAPRRWVPLVACGLIISAPAQSNLRFGQVSVFIVLLALVDAMGLTPARYRGVLVGLAAAIKLTPLLFIVFFAVSGRWRDAGRAAAAFAGAGVVAALVLPAESQRFWTDAVFTTSRIGDLASLGNQSLHGLLLRAGVPPGQLPMVWAVLIAVVCGVGLWRARGLQLAGEPGRAAVMVGCATVAVSPVSWTHHQIWPVLAAMLFFGTQGVARKVAGALLLVVMTASLGVLLSDVSMRPGLQFLFENARAIGAVAVCLFGFGGVAVAAVVAARRRAMVRAVTTAIAALALFALMPLPAQADPSFKAYSRSELDNPRYFFFTGPAAGPISYGTAQEPTKSRMSGLVSSSVARLEYQSAPGGPPREIPLAEIRPGQRAFAFRCANLASGRLIAYDAAGNVLMTIAR